MEPLETSDPEAIGPYRLIARLGAGGMGRVYLARSAGGRTVAVKVVRPELAGDAEFRERFGREVAAARAVDGAYTAPVVDAELTGEIPWLATAYVLGPSLTEAVHEHGPLPESSVRALGAGLAQALRAIHAAGLVHRDLKPSNVLLAADGPRVIDFGIARAVDGDQLTRTGIVVGSPGYMCPEQASGRPMGAAGDVFSLGSVLLYAATGHGPFESESGPAAQLYRVVHDEPELGSLPDALRPAITACLAKDPARRPTPEQLSAMLAPGGAPSVLRDGWLPVPVASALARHAAAVMDMETPARGTATAPTPSAGYSPTTTDAAAVGAVSDGTMKLGSATTTPLPTTEPRPSRRGLLLGGGGLVALAAAGGAAWALGGSGSGKAAKAATTTPKTGTAQPVVPVPSQSRPDGVPPQPLWTYAAQGRLTATPALVAGNVLHPPGAGLVAVDTVTGKEVWARRDVSAMDAVISSGRVYLDTFQNVVGYDSASGKQSWQSATKDPSGQLITPSAMLGADDHAVYLLANVSPPAVGSTGTDGVLAFSVASQQQLWFQPRKKGTDPLVDASANGGNIYYTDDQDNLVARSGQDGKQLWFASTGAAAAYPFAVDATQAYCLVNNDGLQAVRLSDGVQQWALKVPAGEQLMYTPVTVANGVVYGTDGTATVVAWDAKSGKVLWSCPVPQRPSAMTPPLLLKETLFVPGTGAEGLYAIDIKAAKIRWTFKNGLDSGDDWYLATDGERLFATFGATVYALPPV
ncbi:outer membrane protein assembly factor BamB [Kitasatospora sp. MAP12-15]|uniref:serine/threonine-protein kinase n=1 Tax=unclassified Kitasatospora TaxID=2633591 RepID=UPI002476BB4A|nr:serine/threonine-protein kinase [Kitasatospora sp. MAP12-44]MDH6112565.1 outer membrane protein assembly factor BamB [Kitasatospora sp. MAP12-44]